MSEINRKVVVVVSDETREFKLEVEELEERAAPASGLHGAGLPMATDASVEDVWIVIPKPITN